MRNLVSIILPFYNAEKHLKEAIDSVLIQTHKNWELLIINDGCSDQSKAIALSFQDARMHYFEQVNNGVAAARNVGLAHMRGDYFCFLDADDYLPPNSISARLKVFEQNPALSFVDGQVKKMDAELKQICATWRPYFQGNPLSDLVQLTGRSFFGPTWMIKRENAFRYRLREGLTHGEDLLFYMELARSGGNYDYTEETILLYRDNPGSAMKNLAGLEAGYRCIESEIATWQELTAKSLWMYRIKYRKAMFLSYLNNRMPLKAINSLR